MGMTICEKILARSSLHAKVKPEEYIWANVDGTSIIGGQIYQRLEELGIKKLFNPDRIFVTEDHMAPSPNVEAANLSVAMRMMVKKFGISNYFELGRHGIHHELFPHNGYISPGDFIASIDSHSTSYGCFNVASCSISEELPYVLLTGQVWLKVPPTIKFEIKGKLPGAENFVVGKDVILYIASKWGTDAANYKSIEFTGRGISQISMAGRFTMANMSAELGAKFAIFPCDDKTIEYLQGKMTRSPRPTNPDPDACYEATYSIDVTNMPPYLAIPHDLDNCVPVNQVASEKIKINQAFIGSCTNGRMEDFRMAARILKQKRVHPEVRLIATPASEMIWKQCLEEGIWDIFSKAEAVVTNSTCGACAGIHLGVLGDGEVCISTSNRNFQGRMGSPKSFVYLANPATVAASAITGYITDPRQFL